MGTTWQANLFPGDVESDTFRLSINGQPTPVAAIPSLQTADYPVMAQEFRRFKQACWIDPPRYMGVHYAHLAAEGPLTATITCPHPVKSCQIHPRRRNIAPKIEDTKLTIEIPQTDPRYLILDIDDYPPLLLIVDPPTKDAFNRNDRHVLDLAEFVSDEQTVQHRTEAVQRAVLQASKTNRTLYFPAGVHYLDTLKIHHIDGLKIYFEKGSLIRTAISPPGQNIHSHGLWLQDSKNIEIKGHGCLDQQGFGNFAHGRNAYNHGLISYYVSNDLCPWLSESPVFMMRCQNVTMEGFMVRNGRNMNYNIRHCDDVTLRRCKIVTPPASCPEYTDGYHTNSCRNVLIENCLAYCNDDCFASGHYTYFDDRDSANHVIRGLVGWNIRANGIRLGFHTYYNLGDYHFENCDFAGYPWRGLMVHPLHDAEEAERYQRYGTISLTNCGFDGSRQGDPLIEVDSARIANLRINDCTFQTAGNLSIRGHDPHGLVDTLEIQNTTIATRKLTATPDPNLIVENAGQVQVSG